MSHSSFTMSSAVYLITGAPCGQRAVSAVENSFDKSHRVCRQLQNEELHPYGMFSVHMHICRLLVRAPGICFYVPVGLRNYLCGPAFYKFATSDTTKKMSMSWKFTLRDGEHEVHFHHVRALVVLSVHCRPFGPL